MPGLSLTCPLGTQLCMMVLPVGAHMWPGVTRLGQAWVHVCAAAAAVQLAFVWLMGQGVCRGVLANTYRFSDPPCDARVYHVSITFLCPVRLGLLPCRWSTCRLPGGFSHLFHNHVVTQPGCCLCCERVVLCLLPDPPSPVYV